jgi:hypothetical protein
MLSRRDKRRLKRIESDPDPKRAIRLWLREIEAASLPASPGEVTQLRLTCVEVYCEPLAARITVAECIRRASAKTASGRGRGYPIHEACGRCPLKDIHRAMAPGFAPAPYRPFSIQRDQRQRAARSRLWKAGRLDSVPTIDSPNGEE